MLSWVVDNAQTFYLLFGLVALGLAAWWWRTKQGKFLVAAGGAVVLVALVFVLSLLVMTDRKQLVANVHEVIGQINRGDLEGAFKRFEEVVALKTGRNSEKLTRKQVVNMAKAMLGNPRVDLVVWNVGVDRLEGPQAVVSFYVRPADETRFATCKATCVRVGELDWRVKALEVDLPAQRD